MCMRNNATVGQSCSCIHVHDAIMENTGRAEEGAIEVSPTACN